MELLQFDFHMHRIADYQRFLTIDKQLQEALTLTSVSIVSTDNEIIYKKIVPQIISSLSKAFYIMGGDNIAVWGREMSESGETLEDIDFFRDVFIDIVNVRRTFPQRKWHLNNIAKVDDIVKSNPICEDIHTIIKRLMMQFPMYRVMFTEGVPKEIYGSKYKWGLPRNNKFISTSDIEGMVSIPDSPLIDYHIGIFERYQYIGIYDDIDRNTVEEFFNGIFKDDPIGYVELYVSNLVEEIGELLEHPSYPSWNTSLSADVSALSEFLDIMNYTAATYLSIHYIMDVDEYENKSTIPFQYNHGWRDDMSWVTNMLIIDEYSTPQVVIDIILMTILSIRNILRDDNHVILDRLMWSAELLNGLYGLLYSKLKRYDSFNENIRKLEKT